MPLNHRFKAEVVNFNSSCSQERRLRGLTRGCVVSKMPTNCIHFLRFFRAPSIPIREHSQALDIFPNCLVSVWGSRDAFGSVTVRPTAHSPFLSNRHSHYFSDKRRPRSRSHLAASFQRRRLSMKTLWVLLVHSYGLEWQGTVRSGTSLCHFGDHSPGLCLFSFSC